MGRGKRAKPKEAKTSTRCGKSIIKLAILLFIIIVIWHFYNNREMPEVEQIAEERTIQYNVNQETRFPEERALEIAILKFEELGEENLNEEDLFLVKVTRGEIELYIISSEINDIEIYLLNGKIHAINGEGVKE